MRVRGLVVPVAVAVAFVLSGCAVIQRASVAPGGEPNGPSTEVALSSDGSVTAFTSTASNLVVGDGNGASDVFVRDGLGVTTRVSVASNGAEANGPSSHPSVSADGTKIAFQSDATNLVPGDTNATADVFVRDLTAHTTTLVSAPAPGAAAAASHDGPRAAAVAGSGSTNPPTADTSPAVASLRTRAALAPQRVIVRTATTFRAEGKLSVPARTAQRSAIRRDQDKIAALIGTGGHLSARAHTLPIVVATVDAAALDRLTTSPTVVSVVADDPVPAALVDSGPVVGLPASQDAGYSGRGIAVAILDTGVDSAHSFLGNRVVDESCYSAVGSCPSGTQTQTGPGSAAPCTYAPSGCRHGTHVAGIAAGSALDATGMAPRASIIAVQVFSRIDNPAFCTRGENPCPLTFPSDWILGLEHVYELRDTYKIAAANMSIGGIPFQTACDTDVVKPAIDQLRAVGIATVVAAGNEGRTDSIDYPACISSSVSVGATDDADNIASFSNSHPQINLFATGVSVRSSVPGGGFAFFNGTSMATPHVTGAFALAKEQNPNATVDDILARMKSTGPIIHDARNGVDTPRLCTSGALGFDRCPTARGSSRPSISADGQRVAFESGQPLVAADTNGVSDIYVRDVTVGATLRASVGDTGAQGTGASTHASISSGGQLVAFDSRAPNLVTGDTNGVTDVFERDTDAAGTRRVSVGLIGQQGALTSRDASIAQHGGIVFATDNAFLPQDNNGTTDVYSNGLPGSGLTLESVATGGAAANGPSRAPSVSAYGRFIVFTSDATNLDGADTNGETDAFVRDHTYLPVTERVSTGFWSSELDRATAHVTIAAGGGLLAIVSGATNATSDADTNAAFDVFRRSSIVPRIAGSTIPTAHPGETVTFTINGLGFRPPMVVGAGSAGTAAVTFGDSGTVTGTITVNADTPAGSYNLTVAELSGDFFSGTLCIGCLKVTP